MDEIVMNLKSPAWWFTGIFFVALFKLLPVLTSPLKGRTKMFFRGLRLKQAKFIMANRHNLAAVNYQSIKSQSYFVVYMLICAFYFTWYVAGPLIQIKKESTILFIICLLPMMIFQIMWMNQNDNAKLLVSEYNKVRIRSKVTH
ncbi:hypothetical protein H9X88_12090 [Aeromonas hydrophila]|uniref:hypothetical protein n=1 Tax=Aeromonas hydrophila TaxID=644 RepID=UPI001B39CDF6|nr:hypothetical protein [Aeromonas hydrophila]MBQ4677002.1 hypothetical protein [Aeromonas hydrophila]MBW3813605.1 hypothetical protein [Aeromonas hydrophila]MCF7678837.1 hypothetical protein [Aeromonas hydrophila]MCF7691885.1 hypothetical protein [Aeromonas hydrophila]MCF7772685.1 hypothetical protein [Aeromonas hydrophila]